MTFWDNSWPGWENSKKYPFYFRVLKIGSKRVIHQEERGSKNVEGSERLIC